MKAAGAALLAGAMYAVEPGAQTAGEHAALAKKYRVEAETLEAKAAAVARQVPAMAHKWPSMMRRNTDAAAANRQAAALRTLAERHYRLAVEAGFADAAGN
jgi:hypothetical protein